MADKKNNKKMLYRAWQPYISETMVRHIGPRSSGNYGTGVYAYCDLDRAKEDSVDVYGIDVSNYNMFNAGGNNEMADIFKPGNLDRIIDVGANLNHAVRDIRNHNKKQYESHIEEANKNANWLPFEITQDDLENAVKKTAKCFTNSNAMEQCSQPINHLFRQHGYDGIIPKKENCNENQFGAVIFAEAITQDPFTEQKPINFGTLLKKQGDKHGK